MEEFKNIVKTFIDGCITKEGELDNKRINSFIDQMLSTVEKEFEEQNNPERLAQRVVDGNGPASTEEQNAVATLENGLKKIGENATTDNDLKEDLAGLNVAIEDYVRKTSSKGEKSKKEIIRELFTVLQAEIDVKKQNLLSQKRENEELIEKFGKLKLVDTRKNYTDAIECCESFYKNPES